MIDLSVCVRDFALFTMFSITILNHFSLEKIKRDIKNHKISRVQILSSDKK